MLWFCVFHSSTGVNYDSEAFLSGCTVTAVATLFLHWLTAGELPIKINLSWFNPQKQMGFFRNSCGCWNNLLWYQTCSLLFEGVKYCVLIEVIQRSKTIAVSQSCQGRFRAVTALHHKYVQYIVLSMAGATHKLSGVACAPNVHHHHHHHLCSQIQRYS